MLGAAAIVPIVLIIIKTVICALCDVIIDRLPQMAHAWPPSHSLRPRARECFTFLLRAVVAFRSDLGVGFWLFELSKAKA